MSGLNPGRRVFHDNAVSRFNPQAFRRRKIDVGTRLPLQNIFGADQHIRDGKTGGHETRVRVLTPRGSSAEPVG